MFLTFCNNSVPFLIEKIEIFSLYLFYLLLFQKMFLNKIYKDNFFPFKFLKNQATVNNKN